jgi:hypothetical protein
MGVYHGVDGFLPGRGSLMLDVIVVAMLFVLAALGWSVYSVKFRRKYQVHKRVQIAIAAVLALVLVAFEVDIQLFNDWRERAGNSPYFDRSMGGGLAVDVLWIHLAFASTTVGLWLMLIVGALRKFARPPEPGGHSRFHARWGTIAALDMVLTAVSGWTFYWLAFVA